jgi:hypothetical protein
MIQGDCWALTIIHYAMEEKKIWAQLSTCPRAFVRAPRQGGARLRTDSRALHTRRWLVHANLATSPEQPDQAHGLACRVPGGNCVHWWTMMGYERKKADD